MSAILRSYLAGRWIAADDGARPAFSAIDGTEVARAGHARIDAQGVLDHARSVGGPALRALGFHDRAKLLKAVAGYIAEHKEALYELSFLTGCTRADSAIDIEGGIGATQVFAAKGRSELPDGQVFLDGEVERLSRNGSFLGQHICTPLRGAAIHINAFNFPVWGMMEKLAPALLAGVPCIVKPATATAFVTEACFRMIVESGILPEGSVQLLLGGTGDLLDRLTAQDVVSFTGSAATAAKLRAAPPVLASGARFIAEQDSLNASVLGPDAAKGTPEFDLFVKEAAREITAKAGQKCTAIRRIMAPEAVVPDLIAALSARLAGTKVGDPRREGVRMGALVSREQRADVLEKAALIGREARLVSGDPARLDFEGADARTGAFLTPLLFLCADPDAATIVHETEAFGPVSTVMAYRDPAHAAALMNRGGGSLVASLFTHDPAVARELALATAAWHGRLYINDRDSGAESTGHGAPMPHMTHGGPGRAGGGEEMGGIRVVMHYMQRTAVQGSPAMLTAIGGVWVAGAPTVTRDEHPFARRFGALEIGETIEAGPRTVTLPDIEHFAEFTGDRFYAHMDEAAAKANPFFPGRVAHGYLLLAFAAGLFVKPEPGPVLANTGLTNLRFLKPVSPGEAISVRLTVRRKTRRTDTYGEVRWAVAIRNGAGEEVAAYDLHTMNLY